jgi:hypothetical protein
LGKQYISQDGSFNNLSPLLIQVLELVNKHPLRQEFSTQTALHIQPEHVFDEETFFKRYIQQ